MPHQADGTAGPGRSGPLRLYVAAWALSGAGAALAVALLLPPSTALPGPAEILLLVLLTAFGEAVSSDLRAGSSGISLSLLEAAVVADLLLLPAPVAVAVVVGGVALRHLSRRTTPQKLVFNLGQHAVAASLAAAVLASVPPDPAVSAQRVVVVMLAILAYSLTNTVALAGVFARLGAASVSEQLTDRPGFLVATTLGNASIGVIAVALWLAFPSIIWVVVAPALALYLSYGSSFRIERLLANVREERDRLDRVVDGVQEGIVLLDHAGVIRLWNAAMVRITGIAASSAVGASASDILTGRDPADDPVDPLAALRGHSQQPTVAAVTLTHTGGSPVEVRFVHGLLHDERGRPLGDVVVVVDLSREREAAALKEDFVARVSHELRTPLNPLRGYAQIMLAAGPRVSEPQRRELLESMIDCVDHLNQLVDDLLLVSRIASGRAEPTGVVEPEAVDLGELVARLADWERQASPDRPIHVEIHQALPTAWADPLRTGQIVTNLLTNACRYATPGTPVTVTLEGTAEHVAVTVRDQGPGIPADKLETIFDRFNRLENPQRMRTRGLGLGLYIARQLAEVMNASLTVTSQQGVGSTFRLQLPVAAPPRASGRKAAQPVPASRNR